MTQPNEESRVEHDSMGEVRVPLRARWGAQTQRAVENFPVSGERLPRGMIEALARIKGAAANVNAALGIIGPEAARAISQAAAEVTDGRWDAEFPIDIYQTGSGTSSNMNANEVLASLAAEALGTSVHPNDEVNASQSSNDVFPSAIHLAAAQGLVSRLVPALERLAEALEAKAVEFDEVVKSGRTHLMDATPVTLGQEFGGYAAQVRGGIERLHGSLPRVAELPLGGTAVGTGINMPAGFAQRVIDELRSQTGLPLSEARNHFAAQGSIDALVELSGQLRTIAVSLVKIANDVRWMNSGPRAGLGEISVPDLQPGSSIMPGKVNPVIAESLTMVTARVIGNDATVAFAGAAGSLLELNVMMPVAAHALLESIAILASGARNFARQCVDGLRATERGPELVERGLMTCTALAPRIGYDAAAAGAKTAHASGRTVREVARETTGLGDDELAELLDPEQMTAPGLPSVP